MAAVSFLQAWNQLPAANGGVRELSGESYDNTRRLELIILAASLGSVLRIWANTWGLLLLLGVVLAGILMPLCLEWRPHLLGRLSLPAAAVLVLAGGFLLRLIVILSQTPPTRGR